MMTQSGIPDTVERQLEVIDEIGGPLHENHYPVGWSWAGSSPFQWMKSVPSHFGGTRNGMVVTWPAHLTEKGALRTQFHHVIDIVPTIYEAAGVTAPTKVNGITQKPIAGVSMLYTFNDAAAPSTRDVQYFETGGHRAIYQDGWVATAFDRLRRQLRRRQVGALSLRPGLLAGDRSCRQDARQTEGDADAVRRASGQI